METRMTCPTCHGSSKALINFRFSGNQTTKCARCGGRGTIQAPTSTTVPATAETVTGDSVEKAEE